MSGKRRVVISSSGVISSLGDTPGRILESLKEGRVGFRPSSADPQVAVCPVAGFRPKSFLGPCKDSRYLHRGALFAAAAAMIAVRECGIAGEERSGAGLFVGVGPNLDIGGEFPSVAEGKLDRPDLQALWILRFLPNTAASVISKLAQIHGENLTVTTACAASLQAIGEGFRRIREGHLDLAFAGGGDSRLSPGGILAYKKAHALCVGAFPPDRAMRPFDVDRAGFVPGEGGAFFLLEELEHARRRNAPILAEVCGYGSSLDGYSMTAPDREGKGARRAVEKALREARVAPSEIDVVFSHGTSTPLNDEVEARLIEELYPEGSPPIVALKSWIGHIASACGALELGIALYCMRDGYLPGIRNLRAPCNPRVRFLDHEVNLSCRTAIIQNFGFGGQNAALVIRRYEPHARGE